MSATIKNPKTRADLLEALLELFTEEQLAQFESLSNQARENSRRTANGAGAGMYASVTLRFKNGQLRFMGSELWEEAEK